MTGCRSPVVLGLGLRRWLLVASIGFLYGLAFAADSARPAGYLFAHMTKEDYGRLYYSISTDGLHWRRLNRGQRVLPDYRGHPDITRGHDGRFVLTGNLPDRGDIRFWASSNLVTWTQLRDYVPDMSAHPGFEGPGRWHGAPKLFWDDTSRQYLLTWHFSNHRPLKEQPEHYWSGMRTFRATSPDLVTFTKVERLFPFEMATIDVIVRREGGKYIAVLKDERYPGFDWPTGKTIRLSLADHLLGPYSPPGPPVTPNFREAPMLIPRADGRGWYLYSEQYPGVSYSLVTAPALTGPWHGVYWQDYGVLAGARHGCMVPLNQAELAALITAHDRE